jgi:protoporphyrinogen/coproporphyrinogen III oxidase
MSDPTLYDALIVGGGVAGLAAAWRLRHRRILLLEGSDRFGGRLRSEVRGDYWMNWGAHLFPGPGTLVDRFIGELGLDVVRVTGSMMGLAVGDRLVNGGRPETYPLRLPLSSTERVAFAGAGLRVRRATARYLTLTAAAPGEAPASVRARALSFLDSTTFGDFLGPLPPAVEAIFACAAHRATADLDELSAGCGIGLFALVWAGKGSLIARNLRGGPAQLPVAMAAALGEDRVRSDAIVDGITLDGSEAVLACTIDRQAQLVRGRQVIVAVPPPQAAPLLDEVAPAAAGALRRLTSGCFLSVAIETNERSAMPWDDVYAMATPGRSFDLFTNQGHSGRAGPTRRPGGSLMLFAGGRAAARLAEESDAVITDRFLSDLFSLYPETRTIIADAAVHRWALGNNYASPGRAALQEPLEGAIGPGRNVHLAGDYFSVLGNMEAAAISGDEAGGRAEVALAAPRGDLATIS